MQEHRVKKEWPTQSQIKLLEPTVYTLRHKQWSQRKHLLGQGDSTNSQFFSNLSLLVTSRRDSSGRNIVSKVLRLDENGSEPGIIKNVHDWVNSLDFYCRWHDWLQIWIWAKSYLVNFWYISDKRWDVMDVIRLSGFYDKCSTCSMCNAAKTTAHSWMQIVQHLPLV